MHGPDVDELDPFLQPLPPERAAAVKTWLDGSLGDCPICVKPVRVIDPHELIKAGIAHRSCVPAD